MAVFKTNRFLLGIVAAVGVFAGSFGMVSAVSTLLPQQGGTGTTSPSGILYGTNSGTTPLQTVGIGSNLTFIGGVLSASGSGGTGLATTSPVSAGNLLEYSAAGAGSAFGVATTTASCSGSASCTPFTVIGSSPVSISASGGSGFFSSSGGVTFANTDPLVGFPTFQATSTTGTSTITNALGIGSSLPALWSNLVYINCSPGSYPLSITTGGCTHIDSPVGNLGPALEVTVSAGASAGGRGIVFNQTNTADVQDFILASSSASNTTVFNLKGMPTAKGIIKCEHTGGAATGFSNGSCLSIDVSLNDAQGIFIKNGTGIPLNIQNSSSATIFKVDSTGTVTNGIWNGTLVASGFGGTGVSAIPANQFLYGNAAGTQILGVATSSLNLPNAALANSTVSFTSGDSSLTVPASIALGASGSFVLNLTHANTWTGAQTFNNGATTTNLGVTNIISIASSTPGATLAVNGAFNSTVPLLMIGTTTLIGSSTAFIVNANGVVGIGTPRPTEVNANARLTVVNNGSADIIASTTDDGTLSDALVRVYASGSSVFLGAHGANQITTQYGITVGGYAEVGAINGNFGTSNGLLIGTRTTNKPIIFGNNSLERMRIDAGGNVGVGTSSPGAVFSVNPQFNSTLSAFIVGTTTTTGTSTSFIVDQWGETGIGTSSPGTLLSIGNTGGINFTLGTTTHYTTGGIDLRGGGCFAINGTCVGGGSGAVSSVSNADGTLTISPTTGGVVASLALGHANTWTAAQTFNQGATTTTLTVSAMEGIGTTTPQWPLQVAASAKAQITISDTSNFAFTPWSLATEGNNLYWATSSPTTFATSTNTLFSIVPNSSSNATTTWSLTDFVIKQTSAVALSIRNAFNTEVLRVNTASTTGSIFTVAATTSPSLSSPTKLFDVDQYGHLTASSTRATPTLSCTPTNNGTVAANSNDVTGDITTGTLATSCTVTFGSAYAVTPEIILTGSSATVQAAVSARSTTAFTITLGSAVTGDDVSYFAIMP